jgi:hypothetical protein
MRSSLPVFLFAALTVTVSAQSVGPDVTASSLTDVAAYGQANGITAFAVGTLACNVGTQPVTWIGSTNLHPVIAQNMYRYSNGTFQQVGMSWLKHAFVSTNSPGCGSCIQPPNGGAQLGVGCTDAYGAGLNGSQSLLGPRSAVNASTGAFPYPHATPTGNATIAGRVQVANADLGIPGATYFVEALYVTADDAAAGNDNNNATWQQIVSPAVGANGSISFAGPVHAQQSAIYAWQQMDPAVVITPVDFAGDGRFFIGKKITSLGGGNYHYEFAVQNMNSDRSGRGFTVTFPGATTITNAGFRSIPYHSGETYSSAPWNISINGTFINFATDSYVTNINANALRWGTMYSFWFDATAPADSANTIEPFKPPNPCSLSFTSPLGAGSIKMDNTICPAGVGKDYFVAITLNQGNYPNGWLYGVDIPFTELASELTMGYPFLGPLDSNGASTFGPISFVPSGMTIYAVTLHATPGLGSVSSHRPSVTYTVP